MSKEGWWIKIMGDVKGRWLIADLRNGQLYTADDRFVLYDMVQALVKTNLLTGEGKNAKDSDVVQAGPEDGTRD